MTLTIIDVRRGITPADVPLFSADSAYAKRGAIVLNTWEARTSCSAARLAAPMPHPLLARLRLIARQGRLLPLIDRVGCCRRRGP